MKFHTATAFVLLFAATAFAQLRETVNVNIVEVPVSVVDASGNPIRGLTAANFEVYDGGKKQAITSFDKIDFGSKEAVNAISPLNPAARRSFLLLFDLGFSTPHALERAQDAARRFVATAVQPRDLVGVGTVDTDHGFRFLTAFTTDHDLVESAISDPHNFHGSDPLQIGNKTFVAELASGKSEIAGDSPPMVSTPSSSKAKVDDSAAAADNADRGQQIARGSEQFVRARVEKQIDYLSDLARTLRAVRGRKQVILLSEGFDAKYLQGRDARDTAANARDFAAVASGKVWDIDTDTQFGSTSSQSVLDRMAQAFRNSDVVLNAIDIQGVRVQNDAVAGATLNSNAGLFFLSRPTGGEVFQNSNDLKSSFDRMLQAQEVVYVLGFQSPTASPGKFHDLKVKVINSPGRPSFRLGYYENGAESPLERSLTTAEVIVNDVPQDDVRMAAFAASFPSANGNSQVPVILDLNGSDLAKQAKGNAMATEIFIYAFDSLGIMRDRLYQRLTLDMTKVGDRLRAGGVRYYGTLVLPPGTYAIKSLVRAVENDKKSPTYVEKRGFARVNVIVPRQGDMSVLPPIPIDEQPQWILVKSGDRGIADAYPFELNGQNFVPSATASSKVVVVVYGATANELTWETTLKTKLLGTIAIPGGTKLVLQLDDPVQLSSLQITVHKKGVVEAQTTSVAVLRP
ncbi:MAG TPA: VWA domain-containing protein [Thermoanaerobaculia bacterium]|jgi:VWFA-related protein|nr:VWA domain-containing protein [Thermoanaerobaculia bacterium]